MAPRPLRNTSLAVAAGLVIGLILVFLWESLSTKPRSQWEIEALLGMPFLGRMRVGARSSESETFALLADPGGPDADAVHALRTNLELANASVQAHTILVTSVRHGEGKSPVAGNLALALARTGRRVALVELDLRDPSVARTFRVDDRVGLTTLLRGACGLDDALATVALQETGATHGSLEVLPAGPLPPHPAELLATPALAEMLLALRERAELVLVDVPPLLDFPDAASVSAHVDGLLLVVGSRRARRPLLTDARRLIEPWQVARLGFALTDTRGGSTHTRALRRAAQPARSPVVQAERPT